MTQATRSRTTNLTKPKTTNQEPAAARPTADWLPEVEYIAPTDCTLEQALARLDEACQ